MNVAKVSPTLVARVNIAPQTVSKVNTNQQVPRVNCNSQRVSGASYTPVARVYIVKPDVSNVSNYNSKAIQAYRKMWVKNKVDVDG